jgi:phi13 family phage major tail protein
LKMPKIGLKKAYYAKMLTDVSGTSVTYDAPVALLRVQQVSVNPKVSRVQVPGDDLIVEDISECLGADLTIQREEFTPAEEAVLLGRTVDAGGGVYGGNFDNPPYVAFGYMRTFKDSSVGLYVWILKTRFAPSNSTADTKPTDNVTPQYDSMSAGAITRESDGSWIYSVKSSDPAFGDTFFTQATLQALRAATTPDAIALSTIVPADDATGIAVGANIVLTFNNKIAYEHITVIKEDGTLVAGAKSWDAAGKVLTFNPTSDLDVSKTYIVAVNGVTDIYGQTLASVAKNFGTTS